MARWWIVGTGAALLALNTAQAQSVPSDVVVRVYNVARLPGREVVAAKAIAEKIFRGIGIQLRWRECAIPDADAAIADSPCMERLEPRELIARIAAGGRNVSGRVFGQAIIIQGTQTSTLATIFADKISAVATRLKIERGALVGRTLAHELGHLLLATNEHKAFGLMRGMWADAVIRSQRGPEWNFSDGEAQQMRQGLVRRTEVFLDRRRLHAVAAPSGNGDW